MYYVTVCKDEETIVRRKPFDDYSEALKYFGAYYQPRVGRGTLSFTTEVIDGEFIRSFAELIDPNTLGNSDEVRYLRSVKANNAFCYDGSYFFLVESDLGIQDTDSEVEDE